MQAESLINSGHSGYRRYSDALLSFYESSYRYLLIEREIYYVAISTIKTVTASASADAASADAATAAK